MHIPLFEYPSYWYNLSDWEFKKKILLKRINKQKFVRQPYQDFLTDRQTNNNVYIKFCEDFLRDELSQFCEEAKVSCRMSDAWAVKYEKGDHQTVHNHGGWGFSGILYVEYDPKVHDPSWFVAPWQDPRTDRTKLNKPHNVNEGTLIIFPSSCLHYAPPNQVNKMRMILSFDLLPMKSDQSFVGVEPTIRTADNVGNK